MQQKKSASAEAGCGLFVFKVTLRLFHSPLPRGTVECWDHGRSSGSRFNLRAPSRSGSTSDILPFVLAYSGGSAGESSQLRVHPSSLSSPCGHLDPLFDCQNYMDWIPQADFKSQARLRPEIYLPSLAREISPYQASAFPPVLSVSVIIAIALVSGGSEPNSRR